MLRYLYDTYVFDDYSFKGRYVYFVNPVHVKYEPSGGLNIREAIKIAKNLAKKYKTQTKMHANGIVLTVPNDTAIKQQDIIDKYFELLHAYEQSRKQQAGR